MSNLSFNDTLQGERIHPFGFYGRPAGVATIYRGSDCVLPINWFDYVVSERLRLE